MHPSEVARAAAAAGLDALAVCDHNSAENAGAVQRACAGTGVAVIPGMEITSAEEVHVVALLPDLAAAEKLQSRVFEALPGLNDEEAFGMQVVVDEHGEVLKNNHRLLIGATTWTVERVVAEIHAEQGLAVAAHVDRESFGIVGQLGMIPAGLALDALEVSPLMDLAAARSRFASLSQLPLLCSSDAHRPPALGKAVTFMLLAEPTFEEVRLALASAMGRAVLGGGRPMEDLAMHILDIAQNSMEAGATRVDISVAEDPAADSLTIEVNDNGRGMDAETASRALDPFFTTRTTRRVGMGLPMLRASARAAGGDMEIRSEKGRGTSIRATFRLKHIDRAPLGDMETTLLVLLAGHADTQIVFRHSVGDRSYDLDSADLRQALDGDAFSSPEGIAVLREAIRQGEASIRSGGT
jgi:anti-sigma regulatory factor (Ser/Thr protein kinase)